MRVDTPASERANSGAAGSGPSGSYRTSAPSARTLSIIVPAYNEARNLAATVAMTTVAATKQELDFEIIIVNDCSLDETGSIADGLARAEPRVRVLHNEVNLGFGGAYKRGVQAANRTSVLMVPGDNAFSETTLAAVLAAIGKADIVITFPTNPEVRPWGRRLISRLYTVGLNTLFGLRLPYYNGINIYPTRLVQGLEIKTDSFGYSAEVLVKLLSRGQSFVAVGTPIQERVDGKSTALRLRNIVGVVAAILLLAWDVWSQRLSR